MHGKSKGKRLMIGAAALLIFGALIWLCWRYYPVVRGLLEPEQMAAFQEQLQSLGAAGALVLAGLQCLQTLSGVIPALPKDVFTYLAALTPLPFRRFLPLSMAARVPMIFCDTFAAGALMAGDYKVAAAAFGVACLAGLGGMLCAPRVLRFLRRRQG